MAVALEIRDGNPWWYLSTDLWVVPGDDPDGTPGPPVVGSPAFLWARVRNSGDTAVEDATVNFYWANPSVGFDRNTANPIGQAFVTLPAGGTNDVLCLTQWVPEYVNGGHECVLAEAFKPGVDPLPATPGFNVPTDRHVAQLNLSVAQAVRRRFHMAFEVHNPMRLARKFEVAARQGPVAEVAERFRWVAALPEVGQEARAARLGFLREPCPDPDRIESAGGQRASLEVGPNGRIGLTLTGVLDGPGAAAVHVEQHADGQLVGGLAVIVVARE